MSRPTTSTTTAPPRRTSRRSARSWAGFCPAARSSRVRTTPVRRSSPASRLSSGGSGCAGTGDAADCRRPCSWSSGPTAPVPVSCCATPGSEHRLRLGVPGEHMALNALAALLAGVELGASPGRACWTGLAAFDGVRRRFEFRGRAAGVAVYDDYAHHPTKVAAQLRAARDVVGAGRVDRRVPAAPLLAHPRFRRRLRPGAGPRRRGGGARRLRRPRGPRARA